MVIELLNFLLIFLVDLPIFCRSFLWIGASVDP